MAFARVSLSRVSLLRHISISSLTPFSFSPLTLSRPQIPTFNLSASLSTQDSSPSVSSPLPKKSDRRWKPMCLYYTQGKCTKMDDPIHLDRFNHNFSGELLVNSAELKHMLSKNLDFFLVLDLEGKIEILEFPVVIIEAKTMDVVDLFHSGNWDLKTKVPQQCKVSKMKLPPYFMEWINLKDVYLNFYKRRATGMMTMMKELQIPLLGSHHLGIDDTKNIARVLQHMLADGALVQITARRNPNSPENVEFLFKNRIR